MNMGHVHKRYPQMGGFPTAIAEAVPPPRPLHLPSRAVSVHVTTSVPGSRYELRAAPASPGGTDPTVALRSREFSFGQLIKLLYTWSTIP